MLIEILTVLFIGAVCCIVIAGIITYQSIWEAITKEFPNSIKILIKEKSRKAVHVGIFDSYGDKIKDDVEIRSEDGVSSSIKEGQIIYC